MLDYVLLTCILLLHSVVVISQGLQSVTVIMHPIEIVSFLMECTSLTNTFLMEATKLG